MSHGPTYFPTKGACIYCGSTGTNLSDEHIVPYALGGQHVIRAASCRSCADITKKFEQKIARDLWGDARIAFNAPSRRKKQRSNFILMQDAENPNLKIKVPAHEYPGALTFYNMPPPGLLQGLPEDVDISKLWTFIVVDDDDRRNEFIKNNTNKLTIKFRNVPYEFGQLLCKIAYGQLLTMLNLDDFDSICLPYIMGGKTNVSYLVGGGAENVEPIPEIGYSLKVEGLISPILSLWLIVRIRLYANTHAPEYQVVGGEVKEKENIDRIIKKLGGIIQKENSETGEKS